METKFKVGDKVLLTKPKDSELSRSLVWIKHMDKYNNTIQIISEVVENYIYHLEGFRWWAFDESWLTKIEEQPTEQVTEQVTEQEPQQCCEKRGIEPVDLTKKQVDLIKKEDLSNIDWEQRRWELASKIYAEMENITLESSVRQAEIFIKYYKQTLK